MNLGKFFIQMQMAWDRADKTMKLIVALIVLAIGGLILSFLMNYVVQILIGMIAIAVVYAIVKTIWERTK